MAPLALALVLAAAGFHALWNRLLHVTDDRAATMAVGNLAGGLLLLPATLAAPPGAVLPLVALSALAEAAAARGSRPPSSLPCSRASPSPRTPWSMRAVRDASPAGYLGAVLLLTGVVLVGGVGGDRARLRRALRPGLGVAFGSTAAYLLVLLAFQHADAGRVSTLREVSVLIGIVLAGEQPAWGVWAGAMLVVTGAVLAAL